jgi:hypothetical protein
MYTVAVYESGSTIALRSLLLTPRSSKHYARLWCNTLGSKAEVFRSDGKLIMRFWRDKYGLNYLEM